jgi:DNA-binding transcriptional ArsR family regulator
MAGERNDARDGPPTPQQVEVTFEALAHEARRHVIQLLAHFGPELPSGYLAKRFSHRWPTTTRHLRVLEAAGIVSVRRDGRNCIYRLERDHVQRVIGGWLAMLEPTTPERTWRSLGPRTVNPKNKKEPQI